mgnify:CR=1 FL=1
MPHHSSTSDMFFSAAMRRIFSITHTAESGIYADACDVGDILERQVLIVAHKDHLALTVGQLIDEHTHIAEHLLVYHTVLDSALGEFRIVEQVDLGIIVRYGILV